LKHLKLRRVLREPQRRSVRLGRGWPKRPYAVRKPKEYGVAEPGDLVQVDTVEVHPLPGVMIKQFTARAVVSRWDVVEAHSRATAGTARQFLGHLRERMPFPVKAIQAVSPRTGWMGGANFRPSSSRRVRRKGASCSCCRRTLPS